MPNEMKIFQEKINILEDKLSRDRDDDESNLPSQWEISIHDRALIFAVCDKGISFLK